MLVFLLFKKWKGLYDIADNTSKEQETIDYLYTENYEYDDIDFDI